MSDSPGAVDAQLLQLVDRPDHLEVLSSWESQDAYDRALTALPLAAIRNELEELLASPIDDRLHHLLQDP
jgi:quinol monooxygenase YgiN